MLGVTAAVVVGAGVGLAVLAYALQDALLYFPTDDIPEPAQVGLPGAEAVVVEAADGLALDAWYVPADGDAVGAVLVLHGNGGNRAHRAPLAAALRDRGLSTLLLDYRGFGGNPGRPSQDGLLADARGGLDWLAARSGSAPERVVVFGESLGTGVAAGLAARQPVGGLILRSPFPSLVDVGRLHYPLLPVGLLLRDRYPAGQWIADHVGPVLVVAGARDDLVPPRLSRELAASVGGPVTTVTVPGAGHNSADLLDGDVLLDAVSTFLRDDVGLDVRTPPG